MRIRKPLVALALTVAVSSVAGIAWAAWSASGSGVGSARATEAVALEITAVTPTADLYPGATAALKIQIKNDNDYPVTVNAPSAAASEITSDTAGCSGVNTGVSFDGFTGQLLPANSDAVYTWAGTVHMSNASVDACQNAVFTIPVSLSGASS